MASTVMDKIYEQAVQSLSITEQAQLIEKIARHLATQVATGESPHRYDWMSVRGIAPNLLGGEDAQAWVSRTRRESDEQRAKQ
ncbi:MAG: hypothetical protein NZT92_04335 [Abditibacteriales bacterium]|nr:hypothetical protein [Abditibacteriales bacterium]MDW8364875.1 hypothetical protein [Abditibacteriales bacterium]